MFYVFANKLGIPLRKNAQVQRGAEFRGTQPPDGAVVEVLEFDERKDEATLLVTRWRPSTEWVAISDVKLSNGEMGADEPAPVLADLPMLEALRRANPDSVAHVQATGDYFVRKSESAILVSHYEFSSVATEREWVAEHVRKGTIPAEFKGRQLRYRRDVAQPLIDAFGDEHIVQALKDRAEAAKSQHEAVVKEVGEAQSQLNNVKAATEQARAELALTQQEHKDRAARLEKLQQEAAELGKQNALLETAVEEGRQRLEELEVRIQVLG